MTARSRTCALIAIAVILSACSDAPGPRVADASGEGEPEPRVIGEVNGKPLYAPFHEQNMNYIQNKLSRDQESADVERYINAKFDAFDMLVQDELLYQEAERQGVAVSDAQAQAEFDKAAGAAGGLDRFLKGLRSQGLGRRHVLEGMKRRLTVDKFVQEKIVPALSVSDQEAVAYYNQHLDRFTPEAWVTASHIFIECPRTADAARVRRAREHAAKILASLRGGSSFEEMARQHSEDGTAALGGRLGRVKKGYAPREWDVVAFSIPVGTISEVVQTDKGFHIIKVDDRTGGEPLPYAEVSDRCRRIVTNMKQSEAIAQLTSRLRSSSQIVSNLE